MEQLPLDIIEAIFIRIDAKELCTKCRLVCKSWRDIIDSPSFLILQCKTKGTDFPDVKDSGVELDFKQISLRRPYNRNFVTNWNANGKDPMSGWTMRANGGNGWIVEPKACHYADSLETIGIEGLDNCWATSYGRCFKEQTIDLEKEGVSGEVMDKIRPTILISDFTSPRMDCGSRYELEVSLLDARRREVLRCSRERSEPQWSNAHWKQVLIRLTDYPEGVRYIYFGHGGKDSQFWRGHYGPKMTGAVVRILAEPDALPWDADTKGEIEIVEADEE